MEGDAASRFPASFMSPSPSAPLVVGLDIGTTKICAIVAGENENGLLSVLGIGARPSSGVRRGIVVDVPETVAAIKDALARASHMAGVEIEGVVAGVTGDHIVSQNRVGSVTVASPGGEVGAFDVERALAATLLEIGRDVEVIHCLPRSFSLDGQSGLRKPIGLVGSRLEVQAHVVTGQNSLLRNTFSCLSGAGVRADALVLEPLATAEAVSTRAERDLGVLVLDIGGGTSDLAAFVDGSALYSAALPVGGNHVTRDISIGLSTPFEFAETLKVGSGAATRDMIPHGEALEVLTAGGASRLRIPRALLGEIIEARMRELFELSLQMAVESGLAGRVPGGLILSGGGALLPGAIELAGKIFGLPVRLGVPEGVAGWSEQVASPQFATAVGLCRFALAQQQPEARRNSLALPSARRVWSLLPPNVVMARSALPQAELGTESEPEAQRSPAPVSLANDGAEEFPAQMQFAPARPENLPVIETTLETGSQPAPFSSRKLPRPRESAQQKAQAALLASTKQTRPEQPQPQPVSLVPLVALPVVALPASEETTPLLEASELPDRNLEKPGVETSETATGAFSSRPVVTEPVPLLAMKDEAVPVSTASQTPVSKDLPAPRPVDALRPVETPRLTEAPAPRVVALRPEPPAKPEVEGPLGLPAPQEGKSGRLRLQALLARAITALDAPPASSGQDETARSRAKRDNSSSKGDSPALHWWLRFKTFIGFGEE